MIDTTQIRESVAAICQKFGEKYWRNLDKNKEYPTDFVKEMTTSGFLNILIPLEYGGAGLGLKEACVVLEEISLQGAHAGACHAQMYVMGTLLRHGSERQKKEFLPKIEFLFNNWTLHQYRRIVFYYNFILIIYVLFKGRFFFL